MRAGGGLVALVVASAMGAAIFAGQPAAAQPATPAPLVFFDIAGPDLKSQTAFYGAVFGWRPGADGRLAAPISPTVGGQLRADPAEKGLYIGVNDVTAALASVVAHGGKVIAPRFEVKGVVVLGLFTDPAGNRLGLVELRDGKPRIP